MAQIIITILKESGLYMLPERFLQEVKKFENEIISNRRYLHSHPEIGFDLKDTFLFVKNSLTKMGYKPQQCGKSGLVALAGGKKKGKVFMLRADMDALPIKEKANVEFCAKNGNMHACGHDMHTAMLLAAAKLLKIYENEIRGTVKLMFQPAEEILQGSKDMLDAGLLKEPKVDAALMIHAIAGMPFRAGTVIVSEPGVSAPSSDFFEIIVQGKGCHGSMPNCGVDPLNVAAHILVALQEINTRELGMNENALLTFGEFNGGTAANVIPDRVVMKGTIRAFQEDVRNFIKERTVQIAESIATAFRAEAKVVFTSGCPTLVNDKDLSQSAMRYAKELLGDEMALSVSELQSNDMGKKFSKSVGSEDFSYISHEVPSVMLALAGGEPKNGFIYPQHHQMVSFDESALSAGSAVYAYIALRWLEEH